MVVDDLAPSAFTAIVVVADGGEIAQAKLAPARVFGVVGIDRCLDSGFRQRDAHQRELDKRHPVHARATLHQRTQHARALGRWLTAGYRRLDLVVAIVSLLGVLLSLGIAALFLSTVFDHDTMAAWIARMHLAGPVDWLAVRENDVSGLSRGLTEAMGGTLEPDETPGGGLTMTLSLPAVSPPAEPAPGGPDPGGPEPAEARGTA